MVDSILSPVGRRLDPARVVGKRVELKTYLEWTLKFPKGNISRVLKTDASEIIPGYRGVYYLVDLDSDMTIELNASREGWLGLGTNRPARTIILRHIIVEMRTQESWEKLIQEKTATEWSSGSILEYPIADEVLRKETLRVREDIRVLGPGGIRIVS